MRDLIPESLTADAFAPFGDVIEASDRAAQRIINQGHATSYDRLAMLDVADGGGIGAVHLYRAKPLEELVLKSFERHPLGTQAFMPLSGRPYLVAVAPAGPFDPAAIRLFRAAPSQGVQLGKGVWHHFLLALEGESDFLVIERDGPGQNLDEIDLAPAEWIRTGK